MVRAGSVKHLEAALDIRLELLCQRQSLQVNQNLHGSLWLLDLRYYLSPCLKY
jgi:hypothetical protein